MPHHPIVRVVLLVLAITATATLSGCAVYSSPYGGGYVYYDYWYYPGIRVYYDIHRHVYFYPNGSTWVQVRVLPPDLRAHLGRYVVIKSRYQQPYREYNEHHQRYPEHDYQPPQQQHDQYRYVPQRNNQDSHQYEHRYEEQNREQNYRYQPPQKVQQQQYHYTPQRGSQNFRHPEQRGVQQSSPQRDIQQDNRHQSPGKKAAPAKDNRRLYDKDKSDKDDNKKKQDDKYAPDRRDYHQ